MQQVTRTIEDQWDQIQPILAGDAFQISQSVYVPEHIYQEHINVTDRLQSMSTTNVTDRLHCSGK